MNPKGLSALFTLVCVCASPRSRCAERQGRRSICLKAYRLISRLLEPEYTSQKPHPLARWFSPHHFISKTEQTHNLQGACGSSELGRMKLGDIEPLLHCQGLIGPVFLQQPGDVFNRQPLLFLSNDFHNSISGDGGSVLPAGRTCREQIPP